MTQTAAKCAILASVVRRSDGSVRGSDGCVRDADSDVRDSDLCALGFSPEYGR